MTIQNSASYILITPVRKEKALNRETYFQEKLRKEKALNRETYFQEKLLSFYLHGFIGGGACVVFSV